MLCVSVGCFMVDMVSGKVLLELKEKYLEVYVVCYINLIVNVKVYCDLVVIFLSVLKILKNIFNK